MGYFEVKRKFNHLLNHSSLSDNDQRDAKDLSLNDKKCILSQVEDGYIFENLVLDAIKDSDSKHYRHDDGFTYGFDDDPFEDVWNDGSDDWDSSDDWSSSDDWGNSNDVFDGDGGFSGGGGSDDSW